MIERQDSKRPVVPLIRRYRRAVIASVIFHVGLLLALLYLYHPSHQSAAKSSRLADAQRKLEVLPAENRSSVPSQDAHAERIRTSINSQIEASSQLPTEQKLDELDDRLKRLSDSAESKDIEQITKTIADVMGLNRNQYQDRTPPAEGSFDANSVQLRDVKRTQDEAGKWLYQALMVDATGRIETVPLSEAEGQTAFESFEKLKQYPIADSIYRQLVMPMIQQVLEPK